MEINFDKEYLRQLYEEGKTTDKKHRFQPHIIARYQLRVKALEQAGSIEETLSHPLAALRSAERGQGGYFFHPGK